MDNLILFSDSTDDSDTIPLAKRRKSAKCSASATEPTNEPVVLQPPENPENMERHPTEPGMGMTLPALTSSPVDNFEEIRDQAAELPPNQVALQPANEANDDTPAVSPEEPNGTRVNNHNHSHKKGL